jgi:AbrB family looped-hinge helix DNA binding protein
MEATTLTSKGQVTIPKKMRDALRLKGGDKIAFFGSTPMGFV